MTWTSTIALSLASSLAASGATALYFRSRLSAAKASASLFKALMHDAQTRALRAEAQLDIIHHKHVQAGKAAHSATRALRAATTEALRRAAPNPPRPRDVIEAKVKARRAARKAESNPPDAGRGVSPASSAREGESLPAPLSDSCRGSAARKKDGSGTAPEHADRTRARTLPRATQRSKGGNTPAPLCRQNRAVETSPAETTMKGASHG